MPEAGSGPLVLGASGQVGWFLLNRLGPEAIAVSRRTPSWCARVEARWCNFDLWRHPAPTTVTCLISAGPLDACVAWLERAGSGALRRVVALSSMSAVHKAASPSSTERALARHLLDQERRLLGFAEHHDIGCTILRPTLIWGAGMDHSLTPFAHAASRRGFALVPSAATGLRQPVHADDLAALCAALMSIPEAAAGVFEAGGGECLPLAELLARTARAVDARVVHLPLPRRVLTLTARALIRATGQGAAWSRAHLDQCATDDSIWRRLGLVPRGYVPVATGFLPPGAASPA